MDYKKFFTNDDVKTKGYDLAIEGRLEKGDFQTIEGAIDNFLQDCFDSIYILIEKNRGDTWCYAFFTDMSNNDLEDILALRLQEVLKDVLLKQVVFIYENGDVNSTSEIVERKMYSPYSLDRLYSNGILRC